MELVESNVLSLRFVSNSENCTIEGLIKRYSRYTLNMFIYSLFAYWKIHS